MTTIDTNVYTMPPADEATVVKVAELRDAIEHLEQIVRRDWFACVNGAERARCLERAKCVGAELISMVCKRATETDMDRRERAIERSTELISKAHQTVREIAHNK